MKKQETLLIQPWLGFHLNFNFLKKDTMNKIILLLFIAFQTSLSFAQAPPQGINYQAVVYNDNGDNQPGLNVPGQVLRNKNIRVRYTIIQNAANGTEVYKEVHTTTTDAFGMFSLVIGQGVQVGSTAFSNINWGAGLHFLKVEIDKRGGTNYVLMSNQQLMSVPYALYSEKSTYATSAGNGIVSVLDNGNGTLTFTYIDGSNYTTPILSGLQGPQGIQGATGTQGSAGQNGLSAYEIWLSQGNTGTQQDFLTSIIGLQGIQGVAGINGSNGKNTLAKTTTETAGVNCTTGGIKIEYGLDANSNGILDLSEINVSLTKYVCNGAVGAIGAQGVQGIQGIQGVPGANGTNGSDGKNTLAKTTTEVAGSNCTTGGIKIEYGLDANNNNVLDVSEINATLTKYVCNGTVGATGATGPQGIPGSQNAWSLTGNTGTNSTTNFIGTADAQDFVLKTNNAERLRMTSNGNLGIGTNSPLQKFHLKNDVFGNDSSVFVNRGGTLMIGVNGIFNPAIGIEVGKRWIEIGKDSSGIHGLVKNSTLDGKLIMGFNPFFGTIEINQQTGGYSGGSSAKNHFITFNTAEGGISSGERMRISPSGYVGIGTNDPTCPLMIRSTLNTPNTIMADLGNSISDGNFRLVTTKGVGTNNVGDAVMNFSMIYGNSGSTISSSIKFHRGTLGNDGSISFTTNNDAIEIMRLANVANTGRVGIGTASPDQSLSVNGNASKAGGGSWATFSDKRVKHDIKPFNDGLDVLMKLKPVTFKYNEKSGYTDVNKSFVGFIAQDVENVAPYMVNLYDDSNGPSGLSDKRQFDESALNKILVNAVQEQQLQIEKLKKQLEELRLLIEKK